MSASEYRRPSNADWHSQTVSASVIDRLRLRHVISDIEGLKAKYEHEGRLLAVPPPSQIGIPVKGYEAPVVVDRVDRLEHENRQPNPECN